MSGSGRLDAGATFDGARAGSHPDRHHHRCDGRRSARRHRQGGEHRLGKQLRDRHRWARRVPPCRAYRHLSDHGDTLGIRRGVSHAGAARRTDRRHQPPVGALGRSGECHRHRGSAADLDHHVERVRQHRSEADVRAAGARPQLDGARAAGAREPDEHAGRGAGPGQTFRRRQGIRAERRRPAGHVGVRDRQPAPVQ